MKSDKNELNGGGKSGHRVNVNIHYISQNRIQSSWGEGETCRKMKDIVMNCTERVDPLRDYPTKERAAFFIDERYE